MAKEDINKIRGLAASKIFLMEFFHVYIGDWANPFWTEEHIEELSKNFYLIPKK